MCVCVCVCMCVCLFRYMWKYTSISNSSWELCREYLFILKIVLANWPLRTLTAQPEAHFGGSAWPQPGVNPSKNMCLCVCACVCAQHPHYRITEVKISKTIEQTTFETWQSQLYLLTSLDSRKNHLNLHPSEYWIIPSPLLCFSIVAPYLHRINRRCALFCWRIWAA